MACKKYIVTGGARFMDHAPGQVFEAEFTEDDERRYIERGSMKLADDTEAGATVAPGENPETNGDGDNPDVDEAAKQAEAEKVKAEEQARAEVEARQADPRRRR